MRRPGGSDVWLQHMVSELLIHSSLFLDQDGWPTPHTPTIIGDRRRESESGDGASPSVHLLPHSLHKGLSLSLSLTYSLNILPISDFNQVFSHHDNPGSPQPQSGSPQWDVLLFSPLFARSLPVPSAALFSRAVVFFTSSSPHLPPRPSRSVLSFGCQPVLSIRRQSRSVESAVRALIWSCQTHQKPSAGLFDIL